MTPDPLTHIKRCRDDALAFISIAREGAPRALVYAGVLLVELGHLEFGDVANKLRRDDLYRMRDEAVREVSRAIEEAE